MYIESLPNRSSPPAIVLPESCRENGGVRTRTLANLWDCPPILVEGFRTLLKGGVAVAEEGIAIRRALPHGHAAAVLGTLRAIGLDRLLGRPTDKRLAPLAIALIASRLVSPASKLATARDLAADTAGSSLGRQLQLGAVDEVELYRALDWLGQPPAANETALAPSWRRPGSTGSPRSEPRRSAPCSMPAPSSCRCSTNAIWLRSPPRSFPASGSWSARTRSWPRNGPASARICCRPPRRRCASWPTRSPAPAAPPVRTRSPVPLFVSKTPRSSPTLSTFP